MCVHSWARRVLFKNAELRIGKQNKTKQNKKKMPTLILQYFGSVGKGQTNIFFSLGLTSNSNEWDWFILQIFFFFPFFILLPGVPIESLMKNSAIM